MYYEGFGAGTADLCIIAEEDGRPVGAAWTRIMNDYGHVDDETPSFAISLYKEYRGQGIGTEMMKAMLALLKEQGYEQASLAVQKENYAVRMYQKGSIMVGKYKVITLCGSTRFKDAFMEAQKRLTLEGNIVISVGLFGHSGDDEVWTEGIKEMLDDMHRYKIDMADEIFVINVGGYVGSSTQGEIEYAKAKGLPIRYLEETTE